MNKWVIRSAPMCLLSPNCGAMVLKMKHFADMAAARGKRELKFYPTKYKHLSPLVGKYQVVH